MPDFAEPLARLIQEFKRLPGIGQKSAQRLAFHVLRTPREDAQRLSQALLDVRVGEIRAGLEGRDATPEERNLTVRDIGRRKDPNFDRHFQEKVASVGPQLERSMITMQRTLPSMMRDLKEAQKSLERAVANLPDPTYPER